MIELQSTYSLRISLEAIRCGEAGLNERRAAMLRRVPDVGNWARFSCEYLTMKDLAYLTAKTGHEFAILRGKHDDILFHGTARSCTFDDLLEDSLMKKRLIIYGHSHPGEEFPCASPKDRETLRKIGQKTSRLISGLTGKEYEFSSDQYEAL